MALASDGFLEQIKEERAYNWGLIYTNKRSNIPMTHSTNYTKKAIAEIERVIGTEAYGCTRLPKNIKSPLAYEYRPEMDPTLELDHERHERQKLYP